MCLRACALVLRGNRRGNSVVNFIKSPSLFFHPFSALSSLAPLWTFSVVLCASCSLWSCCMSSSYPLSTSCQPRVRWWQREWVRQCSLVVSLQSLGGFLALWSGLYVLPAEWLWTSLLFSLSLSPLAWQIEFTSKVSHQVYIRSWMQSI